MKTVDGEDPRKRRGKNEEVIEEKVRKKRKRVSGMSQDNTGDENLDNEQESMREQKKGRK